ncbi:hypothetical protein ACQ7CX_14370 [Chryseobacterium arthrosphaerae]|uniref:hypothetical protein n=1 Tax=Chryseobacterium arthrosphaerae TaxID=651561 RepID=UPI001BAF1753|nr:hypothetical protein [Chryseobacterium arthrosphaerae]QUY54609.1 hypothetical protein I2F65_17220 [Chryseobacterium arthrosphaerae]
MITLDEIDETKIIECLRNQSIKNNIVITPISILKSFGYPVSDHAFLLENKSTISKLKRILSDLNKEGVLIKRKTKQDFKGIKEIGYDYIDKS